MNIHFWHLFLFSELSITSRSQSEWTLSNDIVSTIATPPPLQACMYTQRRILGTNMTDLHQLFGPGFLRTWKACVVVVAFFEPTEEFLWKGLLLPCLHPVPLLFDQWLRDGGVEIGQALSGGKETLPCPHEGTIEWPFGKEERKMDKVRNDVTESTEVSHGTSREVMTFICLLESFKQAQRKPFSKNACSLFLDHQGSPSCSFSYSRESTMDFHLLLHWLSCWAYCFSTFALSMKQATMSLHAWKDCSVRCTVRT